MIYAKLLEILNRREPAVLLTVIQVRRTPPVLPDKAEKDDIHRNGVGKRRLWSPEWIEGSLGDLGLDNVADRLAEEVYHSGKLILQKGLRDDQGEEIALVGEPFFPPDELVVLGGGHISQALVPIAAMLGYQITVVDDRPSFAHREKFPDAEQVICDDFVHAIGKLPLHRRCSVVIVTRGHRHDLLCLEQVLEKNLAYLGMIGSRRRVHLIRNLLQEKDIDPGLIERLRMPIGLDIGAETPEEIAVSIAAELIKYRQGGITMQDIGLLKALVQSSQEGLPAALATVIATQGSTPRKAGAKLLIFQDGRMMGTIGGGCIEGDVRREALQRIESGEPGLFRFSLNNDDAAEEGMACGGTMEVFIAPVRKGD
ncbi:xanthine dehydrogenase [Heliobacillus mobilis]|uniref:Xanthine dehydrogenase n=1 Tax=Heliobacterium mobile TaxID=28064 RepID=A0A6I3SJ92_HELMO|nr:XdhC/CoxI family protein [Heliobacterium mobile]MTV48981.1 xanthine dehydrogenase [Heliobacterium mobile]